MTGQTMEVIWKLGFLTCKYVGIDWILVPSSHSRNIWHNCFGPGFCSLMEIHVSLHLNKPQTHFKPNQRQLIVISNRAFLLLYASTKNFSTSDQIINVILPLKRSTNWLHIKVISGRPNCIHHNNFLIFQYVITELFSFPLEL